MLWDYGFEPKLTETYLNAARLASEEFGLFRPVPSLAMFFP